MQLARILLALGLGWASGSSGLACTGPTAAPPGLDGIVLVTIDTLRADHLSPYGGPDPTPSFEALAAEGTLVEVAYSPTPSTGPAHASLFTGLHPWHHGVLENAAPVPDELVPLASRLRGEGLRTAAFVSSFILDRRFGFDRGFETYWFEPTETTWWRGKRRRRFFARATAVTDASIAWLREHQGEPFFLWLHYFDPHDPYDPPARFALPQEAPVDLDGRRLPPGVGSRVRLGDLIRAYRGEVRYTDAELGRLLDALRAQGLLDRIALVVTADHGEAFGDHGHLGHGANLYEELVRVPLLVRGPGIPVGRRLPGPVQLEDLNPTLLEWLGLPIPPDLDGVSLLGWLRGETPLPRPAVLGRRRLYRGQPDWFYARSGATKWIGRPGAFERYDLALDPRELAGLRQGEAPAALRGPMETSRSRVVRERQLDPEVREALEALGYTE